MHTISNTLAIAAAAVTFLAAPVSAVPIECKVGGKRYVGIESCKAALNNVSPAPARPGPVKDPRVAQQDRIVRSAALPVKATLIEAEKRSDVSVFVRRSLDDLGTFASPSKLSESSGAEFAWTRNGISGNDIWSARGLVGARFLTWDKPSYAPYVDHSLLGVYVQFDRVLNTKLKGNDVDDLTFGLSSEIAFANFLQATHYLRTRGELITDFEGKTKNWNIAWDYIPFGNPSMDGPNSLFAYLGTPLPFTKYFFLTVTPKLRAEYRGSLNGSSDPLFATNDRVFRVGPAITLALDGNSVFSDVPWFLRGTHFQVTYGWFHDTIANVNYGLLDTSLTFNLHPEGFLGLTLSYRRGELETTGAKTDLAKVALTAKFGE